MKTGPNAHDYYCKKVHPVFGSKSPLEHEFQSLPVSFSSASLDILEKIGMYTPSSVPGLKGEFHHVMLQPKRHVGSVHPTARDNMSPVMLEHFAFTKSMQNMQVIAGTNGVTRYVVKVRYFIRS